MKRSIRRALALLLLLCLVLPFAACAKEKNVLLTYEADGRRTTFLANYYTFLASRAKGSLAASGVTIGGLSPTDAAFWNYVNKFDGETTETLAEYQSRRLLESCRFYLAAKVIFEEKGLSLPDATVKEIDDALEELVKTDADGSKTKFNSILAAYGVNYDLLRELYLWEEEIDFLKEALYGADASLVGNAVKDDYLREHYVRFSLIRLDPFVFVYETDENGDVIYYDTASGTPLYDKENGLRSVEEDGRVTYRLPDAEGNPSARYAYDTENGTPAVAMDEDGKNLELHLFEGDELTAFTSRVNALANDAADGFFDEIYAEETARLAADERISGYVGEVYLSIDTVYDSILDDILETIATLPVGGTALLDDESGSFYLFRKEEAENGAWADDSLSQWFDGFSSGLCESLLSDLCRARFDSITLNDEALGSLPALSEIEPDYYY